MDDARPDRPTHDSARRRPQERAEKWADRLRLISIAVVLVGLLLWFVDTRAPAIAVGVATIGSVIAFGLEDVTWLRRTARISGSWFSAVAAYRVKPRRPIHELWREYALGTMLSAGLIFGGVSVLFGPGQTMRWAGALALVGGIAIGGVLSFAVSRPVISDRG